MERRTLVWIAGGAAGALVVGSFLPWVKVTAPFIGSVTKSGIDGGDGWVTLVAGVVVGVCATMINSQGRQAATQVWLVIAGLVAGALTIYEFIDIGGGIGQFEEDGLAAANFGSGLYLLTAGTIGAFVAAFAGVATEPTSDSTSATNPIEASAWEPSVEDAPPESDPGERLRVRFAVGVGALVAVATAVEMPASLLASVPLLAVAVTTEIATTKRWGGFWGEKRPDGSPRYN